MKTPSMFKLLFSVTQLINGTQEYSVIFTLIFPFLLFFLHCLCLPFYHSFIWRFSFLFPFSCIYWLRFIPSNEDDFFISTSLMRVMFRQPHWWDFGDIASSITRRYKLTVLLWLLQSFCSSSHDALCTLGEGVVL